jgi:hypothetical protein
MSKKGVVSDVGKFLNFKRFIDRLLGSRVSGSKVSSFLGTSIGI